VTNCASILKLMPAKKQHMIETEGKQYANLISNSQPCEAMSYLSEKILKEQQFYTETK
jgi:hypothetical protein